METVSAESTVEIYGHLQLPTAVKTFLQRKARRVVSVGRGGHDKSIAKRVGAMFVCACVDCGFMNERIVVGAMILHTRMHCR